MGEERPHRVVATTSAAVPTCHTFGAVERPEAHLFTGTRGWSGEADEDWVGQAMGDAVLPAARRVSPAPTV